MFFRNRLRSSSVDELLDQIDRAEQSGGGDGVVSVVGDDANGAVQESGAEMENGSFGGAEVPTLEQFLEDDDFLPECRVENDRLLRYLARRENTRMLMEYALWPRNAAASSSGNLSTVLSGTDDNSEGASPKDSASNAVFKRSVAALEVLAAQHQVLSDALASDDELMDRLVRFLVDGSRGAVATEGEGFKSKEDDEGEKGVGVPAPLDGFAVTSFARIMTALLSSRYPASVAAIQRSPQFLPSVVHHLRFSTMAEFLVRMLHFVDHSAIRDTQSFSLPGPPEPSIVSLLVENDIFGLLGACVKPLMSDPTSDEQDEEKAQRLRRENEDVLENVVDTVLGLTLRVLQMPLMHCEVADALNVYATPEKTIEPLLDVGIQDAVASRRKPTAQQSAASSSSTRSSAGAEAHARRESEIAASSGWERRDVSLTLALRLCTKLVVTEANRSTVDLASLKQAHDMINDVPSGSEAGRFDLDGDASLESAELEPVLEPDSAEDVVGGNGNVRRLYNVLATERFDSALEARFEALAALLDLPSESELEKVAFEADGSAVVEPLGLTRLCILELFCACLRFGSFGMARKLSSLGIPGLLLRLLLAHEWNSILHHAIVSSVLAVFSEDVCAGGGNGERERQIMWIRAGLVEVLVRAWEVNDVREAESATTGAQKRSQRCGFMGPVIRMAEAVGAWIDALESDDGSTAVEEDERKDDEQESVLKMIPADMHERFARLRGSQLKAARERQQKPLGGELPFGLRVGGAHVDGVGDEQGGEQDDGMESAEAFDMSDVIEGLTMGDATVVNDFANYLLNTAASELNDFGDLSHFGADDDDDSDDDTENILGEILYREGHSPTSATVDVVVSNDDKADVGEHLKDAPSDGAFQLTPTTTPAATGPTTRTSTPNAPQ